MSTRRRFGEVFAFVALGALGAGACGGGVSLDTWATAADEICADLAEDLAEASAEEAEDAVADAVEDLEALEPPGGEDADVVEDAIGALQDAVDASVAAVDDDLDGSGDALAALAAAQVGADVDEEVELIDESGADDCVEAAETGAGGAEAELEATTDALGELADLRVGDCVVLDPDLAATDCEGDDAQGEVLLTALSEPECDDDDGIITQTVELSGGDVDVLLGLCIEAIEPPEDPGDRDNFLEEGSCANVVDEGDGDFTVNEVPCGDADATHEIVAGVDSGADCLAEEINFNTSDAEEDEFGFAFWCAEPL